MGFILVFPDNFLDIIIFKKNLGKKDVFGSKKRPFLRNSGFSQNQKSHEISKKFHLTVGEIYWSKWSIFPFFAYRTSGERHIYFIS